jgi:hypothetical protein
MSGFIGRVEATSTIHQACAPFAGRNHGSQNGANRHRQSRLSEPFETPRSQRKAGGVDLSGSETELDTISFSNSDLVAPSKSPTVSSPSRRSWQVGIGRVTLRAYHRGNHIYIEVEDDGRGIDYGRVKQSDRSRPGSYETANSLTERELREMLSILASPPRR